MPTLKLTHPAHAYAHVYAYALRPPPPKSKPTLTLILDLTLKLKLKLELRLKLLLKLQLKLDQAHPQAEAQAMTQAMCQSPTTIPSYESEFLNVTFSISQIQNQLHQYRSRTRVPKLRITRQQPLLISIWHLDVDHHVLASSISQMCLRGPGHN